MTSLCGCWLGSRPDSLGFVRPTVRRHDRGLGRLTAGAACSIGPSAKRTSRACLDMSVHSQSQTSAASRLWSRVVQLTLGTKYVAVEARNPPAPARGHVEVIDSGLDVRRDVVPIKLRIFIDDVRRRLIAELPVQTSFFKFVEKRIGFSQIVRIAQLTDEIRGSQEWPYFVNSLLIVILVGRCVWESRESDRACDPRAVEFLDCRNAVEHEQLRALDVIWSKCGVGRTARQ